MLCFLQVIITELTDGEDLSVLQQVSGPSFFRFHNSWNETRVRGVSKVCFKYNSDSLVVKVNAV